MTLSNYGILFMSPETLVTIVEDMDAAFLVEYFDK